MAIKCLKNCKYLKWHELCCNVFVSIIMYLQNIIIMRIDKTYHMFLFLHAF